MRIPRRVRRAARQRPLRAGALLRGSRLLVDAAIDKPRVRVGRDKQDEQRLVGHVGDAQLDKQRLLELRARVAPLVDGQVRHRDAQQRVDGRDDRRGRDGKALLVGLRRGRGHLPLLEAPHLLVFQSGHHAEQRARDADQPGGDDEREQRALAHLALPDLQILPVDVRGRGRGRGLEPEAAAEARHLAVAERLEERLPPARAVPAQAGAPPGLRLEDDECRAARDELLRLQPRHLGLEREHLTARALELGREPRAARAVAPARGGLRGVLGHLGARLAQVDVGLLPAGEVAHVLGAAVADRALRHLPKLLAELDDLLLAAVERQLAQLDRVVVRRDEALVHLLGDGALLVAEQVDQHDEDKKRPKPRQALQVGELALVGAAARADRRAHQRLERAVRLLVVRQVVGERDAAEGARGGERDRRHAQRAEVELDAHARAAEGLELAAQRDPRAVLVLDALLRAGEPLRQLKVQRLLRLRHF